MGYWGILANSPSSLAPGVPGGNAYGSVRIIKQYFPLSVCIPNEEVGNEKKTFGSVGHGEGIVIRNFYSLISHF